MWKFFSMVVSDKQVSQRLRRKKFRVKDEEIDDLFGALVKRRKDQFQTLSNDFVDIASSVHYASEYYYPLIEAFNKVEEARENLAVLSLAGEGSGDMGKALGLSLSKAIAQRVFRTRTSSFCMECTLKRGFEPYSKLVKYPVTPILDSKCNKCGGKTIFHVVEIEAPYAFGPLFKENRLPEFVIGYTLASSKDIKRIYVHKKVQVISDSGPLAGRQIDIFAITKSEKVLLIEVTTSKDLNKIWEAVHKKVEVLKDFPYDALAFVTPSQVIESYPRLDKERIFGARHLPKIRSHIEHLIEEIGD